MKIVLFNFPNKFPYEKSDFCSILVRFITKSPILVAQNYAYSFNEKADPKGIFNNEKSDSEEISKNELNVVSIKMN